MRSLSFKTRQLFHQKLNNSKLFQKNNQSLLNLNLTLLTKKNLKLLASLMLLNNKKDSQLYLK